MTNVCACVSLCACVCDDLCEALDSSLHTCLGVYVCSKCSTVDLCGLLNWMDACVCACSNEWAHVWPPAPAILTEMTDIIFPTLWIIHSWRNRWNRRTRMPISNGSQCSFAKSHFSRMATRKAIYANYFESKLFTFYSIIIINCKVKKISMDNIFFKFHG